MESAARESPPPRRLSPLGWVGLGLCVAGLAVALVGAFRGPASMCVSGAVIVAMSTVLTLVGRPGGGT